MDLAGVRLRAGAKMLHFECTGTSLQKGDYAVVPTERGPMLGEVVRRLDGVSVCGKRTFPKVVRQASADDLQAYQENRKKEGEAHAFCLARIGARELPMKLVRTEVLLDRSKTVFYFTADGRVDFRELVKDLAHELRTRIEMRQIGVRDEARMVGGVGPCGKELCCSTFLLDFEPVTVRMAKDQKLPLNPAKLSGVCGRLMCCLIYEHEAYRKAAAPPPPPGPAAPEPAEGPEPLAPSVGEDEEGAP